MGFSWDSSSAPQAPASTPSGGPSLRASMPPPGGIPVLTEASARSMVGDVPPEQPRPEHLADLDYEIQNARDARIRQTLLAEREKVAAGLNAAPKAPAPKGFSWDNGPTAEVPPVEPKKSGFSPFKEAAGLGVGLTDLVGSIPGAILGVGRGAVDVAANAAGRLVGQNWGNKPSVALEGTMGAMESTMPSKLIGQVPGLKEIPDSIKQTYGYRLGMAPAEAIGHVLQLMGSGYEEIVKAIGGPEKAAKEINAASQIGVMLLGLGRGRGRSQTPTEQQYTNQYESRAGQRQTINEQMQRNKALEKGQMSWDPSTGKPQTAAEAETIRSARVADDALAPKPREPWDRPDLGQQTAFPFQQDYVGGAGGGILNPEIIARLERELNPPVERRTPNQMELFSDVNKYESGELINGSRVTTEGGVTPRTRGEPEWGTRNPDPRTLPYEVPGRTEWQYGDRRANPRDPVQLLLEERPVQRNPVIETIPTDGPKPLTERGSVGEQHARVIDENQRVNEQRRLTEEGIPYQEQRSLSPWTGPGRKQRGAIGEPREVTLARARKAMYGPGRKQAGMLFGNRGSPAHAISENFAGFGYNLTKNLKSNEALNLYKWADKVITSWVQKPLESVPDIEIPSTIGMVSLREVLRQTFRDEPARDLKNLQVMPLEDFTSYGGVNRHSELKTPKYSSSELANLEVAEHNHRYSKIPDGEPIWRVGENQAARTLKSHLEHVGDYLRDNVPVEKLSQYDINRALRETSANDARVAKEMEKSAAAMTKELPTIREYPDGKRWVELKLPEKLTPEQEKKIGKVDERGGNTRDADGNRFVSLDADGRPIRNNYTGDVAKGRTKEEAYLAGRLAEEGNQMGHCVGGYCQGVAAGESRIFSLRDSKGRSHVTVEVTNPGINRPRELGSLIDIVKGREDIVQIKGKQNLAPNKEYQPYVQDFVLNPPEGKKWGEVGDAENAGLRRLANGEYAPINEGTPGRGLAGLHRRQGGWIGSFDRTAARKGVTQAILDARKVYREETRPIAEVGKEMLEQKTPDLEATNLANFGIPKQVATLSHNPIIKWAADNLLRIDRESHNKARGVIEGENFKTKANGLEYRALDETRGLGLFHKYSKDKNRTIRAEMSEMKDIHLDNIGKVPLTREAFRTERQWQTYQAIQEGYRKTLEDFNEARVANGYEPIKPINNYSPFILEGDYRVWAKDDQGKTVGAGGVNYSWQAKDIVKLFKKQFPDATVTWGPSQKTRYDLGDLSGFHEAMKIMESEGNPKLAKEFSKIYADIMTHRGAGKRALHKTGVAGPINFLKSDKGLVAYEHAFTSYVNSVYRYIGNVEKSKLQADLIALDKPVKEAQKNTIEYSNQIIDAAKGKSLKEDWVGDAIGAFTEKPLGLLGSDVGLGRNFAHRYISGMSALVLPYLLATGRMMISQAVQPGANLAKLSKMEAVGDVHGNPGLLLLDGYKQLVSPDKVGIEARNWALKKGHTDPTVVSYFDRTIGNLPTQLGKNVMHGLKKGFAAVEQQAVRLPSFLAYEKALREKIPNKEERFEYAAKVMDDTVVNYSEVNMPLIYNKMGVIGQAGKGLKQYAHNVWGHFLDYAAFTKDTGKVAPLGWFLGNSLMVAGLKGMPLVAEAAAFIAIYNMIAGDDVPNPEKMMWEMSDSFADDYPESVLGNRKLHQAMIQGGLSTALQYDVSSSVSHPGLPQMFSFPAIAMTERLFKDSLAFLYKYFKGTATDGDSMKAALAVFPNATHGFIEELYTTEGGMTPNPNRNMEGVYTRDETDSWVAKMLSLRHVDEAKKRAIVQGARMLIKQDMAQKLSAVDAITDRIANGQEITPDLMKQFLEEGGNPTTLSRTIRQRLEERLLDPAEQLSRGKMSPEKYHKLMRMKELLNMETAPKQETPTPSQDAPKGFQWDKSGAAEDGIRPVGTQADSKKRIATFRKYDFPIGKAGGSGRNYPMPNADRSGHGAWPPIMPRERGSGDMTEQPRSYKEI